MLADCAALPKIPPKIPAAMFAALARLFNLLGTNVDMYPFPHLPQWNLNWKPRCEERSE